MSEKLEFTGERFTLECMREIRYEHFHRYALAAEWTAGLKVLDAACGEGYGSHLLATRAAEVTGVDVSGAAVAHAREHYTASNLQFLEADCTRLPFADQAFDCVVSFETLEHLQDHEALLAEFRRVLKPNGFLVISSPDKAVYSDRMGNQNPYHLKELYQPEFEQLLAGYFPTVQWLGQKLAFHSMIWPLQPSQRGGLWLQQENGQSITRLPQPSADPVYLLALCSGRPEDLPPVDQALYLFDDEQESVYQHYNHEIRHNLAAAEVLRDLESRLATLQADYDRLAGSGVVAPVREHEPHAGDLPPKGRSPAEATTRSWLSRLLGKK